MAQSDEPAQASFEDLDRDGIAGLTELVAPFSPMENREHVLRARITPNSEIDEAGTYQLLIIDVETEQTLFRGGVRVAVADLD